MKKAIRLKNVSQWHLLRQLNCYLGKKKIPKEVINKIYYILQSGQLGKNGFLVLSIENTSDECITLDEIVGLYPYKCCWEEKIDEIIIERKNRRKCWYISYARIKGQKTKIAVIYPTDSSSFDTL